MTEQEYQLAVMDDDGAGCAITTSPAERKSALQSRCLQDGAVLSYKFRAAGWVWQCTADARHVVVA